METMLFFWLVAVRQCSVQILYNNRTEAIRRKSVTSAALRMCDRRLQFRPPPGRTCKPFAFRPHDLFSPQPFCRLCT